MKVLNLYAGLGGNRKFWKDCEVTAVEINQTIASFYASEFPGDELIVGDAHEYLLKHFKDFDFIWSSVTCQTHSRARFWVAKSESTNVEPVYPDMKLYQEILFLKKYFDGDWIVENVVPFYSPLVHWTRKIGRHCFWSNRNLGGSFNAPELNIHKGTRKEWERSLGIELNGHKFDIRTDQILRNCVHPELGRQLFDYFKDKEQETQFELKL